MALAVAQIFLWGGSFFLLSVLADPVIKETGWTNQMVYGVLSLSLLISGLVSPFVGKVISSNERDVVLRYSGIVMASGLIIIGLSEKFWIFAAGWVVIGFAMAMGLYDALFALLGKVYGREAGKSIKQITLISGFAPTISWFFVSQLLTVVDWRTTCFIYAAVLVITVFPLNFFALHTKQHVVSEFSRTNITTESIPKTSMNITVLRLMLAYFTVGSIIMTGISVHLIDILLSGKMSLKTAVWIASLIGPSQVGVRIIDLVLPRKTPIKTALVSSAAILTGLILLFAGTKVAVIGVVFFGLGNGMRSILKGTLPLTVFGTGQYAVIMGKLARMPLIAQAATPFIGGFMIQHLGTSSYLAMLALLAFVNILLVLVLKNKIKG